MKILLIDDDHLFNFTAEKLLTEMGHDIIAAENGLFGIHLATLYTPDLILSDYNMPGLNGKEIFLKLKDNPKTCNILFVIVSGRLSLKEKANLLTIGVLDVLEKPIDLHILQNRIVYQLSNFLENSIGCHLSSTN